MDLLAAGTEVVSTIDDRMTGTIVGHSVIGTQTFYVVLMDKGAWLDGYGVYVNYIVCHPESVEVPGTRESHQLPKGKWYEYQLPTR